MIENLQNEKCYEMDSLHLLVLQVPFCGILKIPKLFYNYMRELGLLFIK